jgi:heat shock protein HslJ/uncharacterized membrane protein
LVTKSTFGFILKLHLLKGNTLITGYMKNKMTLIKYFLIISLFTFSCNGVEKKNESEATNSEISKETVKPLPHNEPQSITFKMKLWQEGIDFYARGNEPSWAVDIDMDKGIKFSNLDGIVMETTSLDVHQAADAMITRFSGDVESSEIFVTVTEEECNDTMADQRFRNSVKVEIKKEGGESEVYNGCGQYVPDYGLHDIWVLIEANGQVIDDNMLNEKGRPTFEFYVEEGRISGHAGCNNINGSFYRAGNDVLHFEPMAMTRMMCSEMELEDLIAQSVAGKRMKYEVKDLILTLRGYDDTELIFKKID